jgi:hypothetical protein
MSDRAQDVLVSVLENDIGVCIDVEQVLQTPTLQVGWEASLDYELNRDLWWWFIQTFVDDPNERERIRRAADEIREVFLDLARLHQVMTGKPSMLPEKLIRCLERRLICAMRPSAREVALGATRHPAMRASRNLERFTSEEAWRTR